MIYEGHEYELQSCKLHAPFHCMDILRGLGTIKNNHKQARIYLFILASAAIIGEEFEIEKCPFYVLKMKLNESGNFRKYKELFKNAENSFINLHGDNLEIITSAFSCGDSKLFTVRNKTNGVEWNWSEKNGKLTIIGSPGNARKTEEAR